jgi:hypothetical protein
MLLFAIMESVEKKKVLANGRMHRGVFASVDCSLQRWHHVISLHFLEQNLAKYRWFFVLFSSVFETRVC